MRRLGVVALVLATGCLNSVSDVPDSGPEHRFLGRPDQQDISPRYFQLWTFRPEVEGLSFPPTRIRELTSGDLLLGPFECTFQSDGGVVPATAEWRADARFGNYDALPEPFVFDGRIYKALQIERGQKLTVLGRYDDATKQFVKLREYVPTVDAGVLSQPNVIVRAFENVDAVWFTTARLSGADCRSERRSDFDFTPGGTSADCFLPRGATSVDGNTVMFGWNGTSTAEVRRLGVNETSREFVDGYCTSTMEQQRGQLDFYCTKGDRRLVTIHRADVNSTTQLSSFIVPSGHEISAVVRAEPLLALTGTREDGGYAMHACNQTECRRIADFSNWPPMVGANSETISVAHYEHDAGVFLWRHRRETLGL